MMNLWLQGKKNVGFNLMHQNRWLFLCNQLLIMLNYLAILLLIYNSFNFRLNWKNFYILNLF